MRLRSKNILLLLLGVFLVFAIRHTGAQQPGNGCPAFIETALIQLEDNCSDLGRNTACYGYFRVNATFSEQMEFTTFSQPADQIDVTSLASITTAPFDAATEEWGIAVLSIQANIPNTMPGQAVKFILMGDTELHNAVDPDAAFTPVDPVEIRLFDKVNLRSAPSLNANVLATVEEDAVLLADGISPDREWLRVFHDRANMWVSWWVVDAADVSRLPVIDEETFTPMQAFYFTTGIGAPACNDAPDMLVVQGPDSVLVDLNVNGANVTVGSTAVFRSGAGRAGQILGSVELPEDIREMLNDPEVDPEEICDLVQIMVVSGEVELNRGTLILPEGYNAVSVKCEFEEDDQPQPEATETPGDDRRPTGGKDWRGVYSTNWQVPQALSNSDRDALGALGNLPSGITNYDILPPEAGGEPIYDADADDIPDDVDNCPDVPNTMQVDSDLDGIGDLCDPDMPVDTDDDGVPDDEDNCPQTENPSQRDRDGDGIGNLCDFDADNDGVLDSEDNCRRDANPDQLDTDEDGAGDVCDEDDDDDGFLDETDACPLEQGTSTVDLQGCPDEDRDGWSDENDGCPYDVNKIAPGVCGCGVADIDSDEDGLLDCEDECPFSVELDEIGDPCNHDEDGDGGDDGVDVCPLDAYHDPIGDPCNHDEDGDTVLDELDNCHFISNIAQADIDGDGLGDACDPPQCGNAVAEPGEACDTGGDSSTCDADCTLPVCGDGHYNSVFGESCDTAGDSASCDFDCTLVTCGDSYVNGSAGEQCDPPGATCTGTCLIDSDGDGTPDDTDLCDLDPNKTVPGICGCGVADTDGDGDGVADCNDNCPGVSNAGQQDVDIDGIGTACDPTEDADISVAIGCTGVPPCPPPPAICPPPTWSATLSITNNGPSTATGLSGAISTQVSCSCTITASGWPSNSTFAVGQSGYRYLSCTGSCWLSVGVASLNNPDPNTANDSLSVPCP